MNTILAWLQQRRERQLSNAPGFAMFRGLRIRLTLWYSAVLAVAFILFSIALYIGAQQVLFSVVQTELAGRANLDMGRSPGSLFHACSPPSTNLSVSSNIYITACFDRSGNLFPAGSLAQTSLPPAFLKNTLVNQALRSGTAADIVDGGTSIGHIYRYAVAVPQSFGNGSVAVIMVGTYVENQYTALSVLLTLLVVIGGIALLGAGIGGLFLANRALEPARLAWANQQRFIANASHELRTPLTLLRADAEVLLRQRERLSEDDVDLLEDIVSETNHMTTLATNMLTLARLDSSSSHMEQEVVDLSAIARTTVRRAQTLAVQMNVSVQVETRAGALVIGDTTLLEQAALALLDNAIKYNRPGGQVTVCTGMKQEQAFLEVRDTGIGIAAEHLPNLGTRFYRVDKARSRAEGGTGLGLSIVRGIVKAHHGTLTLASTSGQGTTVALLFPAVHPSGSAKQDVTQIMAGQ